MTAAAPVPLPNRAADRLDRIFFRWIFPVMLAAIFVVYAVYRQRYVGASDWYGYYQQGELLKTGQVYLPTELPADDYHALVPLGYIVENGRAIPQYPPGFPLLLAAGSFLGLTFFVTPLIGLLSCILMFGLIRDLTDRWIAAVFTLAWAFFPIVVFGSTSLMSDLVAATAVLGAYYAYRRQFLLLSAWVLGFGLCVRPTNALFLVVFALPLLRDRRLVRYGLYLIGPGLLYGLYNYKIYGSPWRTGYTDFRYDIMPAVFRQHFGFYLGQTLWQCTPILVALALWGLKPWSREKLFYVLWFASFLAFYSFWKSGGDRWWWSRFLLPGYPAIFLLAALGFRRGRDQLASRAVIPVRRNRGVIALFALVALLPAWEIYFGWSQHDLWKRNKVRDYYEITQRVAALVPGNSFVGSVEFVGAFRIYTTLTGYVSVFDTTPELITEGFRQRRDVYLLVEPWNHSHAAIRAILGRFPSEKIEDLSFWKGLTLYKLHPPAVPALPQK
jgi:hypothetical protein